MSPPPLLDAFQDDARRQAEFAERREEHPGWGAAQQVPAPQHHGAQRPGQEDRHHSGHSKCATHRDVFRSISILLFKPIIGTLLDLLQKSFLFLAPVTRSWKIFSRSTESQLISESHIPAKPRH